MTVAYVVIRPVVALSVLGAKIGFVLGCFIGTLVTNLGTVCFKKWNDCVLVETKNLVLLVKNILFLKARVIYVNLFDVDFKI